MSMWAIALVRRGTRSMLRRHRMVFAAEPLYSFGGVDGEGSWHGAVVDGGQLQRQVAGAQVGSAFDGRVEDANAAGVEFVGGDVNVEAVA